MTTVTESLEERVRDIRSRVREAEETTPLSLLEREIAFIGERLEGSREMHRDLMDRILRAECYVGSDLLALETYNPMVFAYRLKTRDNLKNKLLRLDVERRQLIAAHVVREADLHERLLRLLAQHAHLQ